MVIVNDRMEGLDIRLQILKTGVEPSSAPPGGGGTVAKEATWGSYIRGRWIIDGMTRVRDRNRGKRWGKGRYRGRKNMVHRVLGDGSCGCSLKLSQAVRRLYMCRGKSDQVNSDSEMDLTKGGERLGLVGQDGCPVRDVLTQVKSTLSVDWTWLSPFSNFTTRGVSYTRSSDRDPISRSWVVRWLLVLLRRSIRLYQRRPASDFSSAATVARAVYISSSILETPSVRTWRTGLSRSCKSRTE